MVHPFENGLDVDRIDPGDRNGDEPDMDILGLLALLLILGALRGANDIPDAIRLGCGCLVGVAALIVLLIVAIGLIGHLG